VLELTNQFIEEGRELGLKQGLERGLEQGIESGLRRAAISIARAKFGADSHALVELLDASSNESSLMRFIDSASRGSSLDDLQNLLRQV
jgi:flagellar biosynthesis/type III secretory pathway protein FliH